MEAADQPNKLRAFIERVTFLVEDFGDWMNDPEDIEGVMTRIAAMGLIFGGMVTISTSICFIMYFMTLGVNALFGG